MNTNTSSVGGDTSGTQTAATSGTTHAGDVKEIWFDDGNIIVRAGNRIFRVWKGFLSARSSVFQDMLSFPPSDDQEYIYGCPVVALPDDPEEVTYFFKALFHPNFFMPPPAPIGYAIAAGILRLSHKYNIGYLFHRAILHLDLFAPVSLEDLGQRLKGYLVPDTSHLLDFWSIIRETGVTWMLPAVGWLCTLLPVTDILMGQPKRPGGTVVSLAPKDQCLILNAKLRSETVIFRENWGCLRWSNVQGCESQSVCNGARLRRMEKYDIPRFKKNALSTAGTSWVSFRVCDVCQAASKEFHETKRAATWDSMPKLFDAPGWPELLELRDRMMKDAQEEEAAPIS